MLIFHVVGARPNFMKAAPVLRALGIKPQVRQILVHTGQHYDRSMSEVFFRELEMPQPDFNLEVGSGTHARQTAAVMCALEPLLIEHKPDLALVYGDVNSTLAAALVCSKLGVPVGHVEAGLRSHDRSMPEEINRLLTDQVSDLLFTPSEDANENLQKEGIDAQKIHFVGNVMIDSLVRLFPRAAEQSGLAPSCPYALVTLHRPGNVDDLPWLCELIRALREFSERLGIVFPVHPRTRGRMQEIGIDVESCDRMRFVQPLPYLEFMALQRGAALVITDSGGIQEETTFLGVPCLTARENTERPVTLTLGTNRLVGRDIGRLRCAVNEVLDKNGTVRREHSWIPLWDGHAAQRIAGVVTGSRADAEKSVGELAVTVAR